MYLTEEKIKPNSFIMIEFEDGTKEPYFVNRKGVGCITEATMLLGRRLTDLVADPSLFKPLNKTSDRVWCPERFYIENKKRTGKHTGVNGYRKLRKSEKKQLARKVRLIPELKVLAKVIYSVN
ncbi:MAG: hypothetical protein NTZ44_03285 [Candidatus Nomurabacteria bacterium]|nr:hypothetical protein [Candidatus Nomurabacteria bacterium]